MESSAEAAGRTSALVLVAVLALYFLVRALGNVPRSRRYGNLALFCGLAGVYKPGIAPYLPQRPMLVGLVVLGGAGIGLLSVD